MSGAHKELEVELHGAFARGEFDRLGRFAHWSATQTATPSMPTSWRAALDLAGKRDRVAPADFIANAEARKKDLPLAATAIGLRHGDPGAMPLLTIAAAISAGPLNSALQVSRNQRQYERIVALRTRGLVSTYQARSRSTHLSDHSVSSSIIAEPPGATLTKAALKQCVGICKSWLPSAAFSRQRRECKKCRAQKRRERSERDPSLRERQRLYDTARYDVELTKCGKERSWRRNGGSTSRETPSLRPGGAGPGFNTKPGALSEMKSYLALKKEGRCLRLKLGDAMPTVLSYVVPDQRERARTMGCQSKNDFLWQRDCGHPPFPKSIHQFVRADLLRLAPCPVCVELLREQRSLAAVSPHLEREWSADLNAPIAFSSVAAKSGKLFWWKHVDGCGRTWQASAANRTNGSGCGKCRSKISVLEAKIICESRALSLDCEVQFRLDANRRFMLDVMYQAGMLRPVALEVDGWPFHSSQSEIAADIEVNELCARRGLLLIRIRHPKLGRMSADDIIYDEADEELVIVKRLLSRLREFVADDSVRSKIDDYIATATSLRDGDEARRMVRQAIRSDAGSLSLRDVNPEIADCFDRCSQRNGLTAAEVRADTTYKRLFWCGEDGHQPVELPVDRAAKLKQGLNCSKCRPYLKDSHPDFYACILAASQLGHNEGVQLELLRPGGSYIWWKCSQCTRINWTEIRERSEGRGLCKCEDKRLIANAAPALALLYRGDQSLEEVSAGSKERALFLCGGNRDGSKHVECERMVRRWVKNATRQYVNNGALPVCDSCRSLKRAQNFLSSTVAHVSEDLPK